MKNQAVIETDILIIGAGPCGLFVVFEAGLVQLHCHLIDALPMPGGQLAEIYPKKPIYDIPGFPSILAGELVENLLEQIAPFKPGFTLGERADVLKKLDDGRFEVITHRGTIHRAPVVCIAGGLGCFEPRKPPIENIDKYEDHGVDYIIRDPEVYRNKRIVIAGGGDSALDWTIYLADVAREVALVHRRKGFRGAPDSVGKVMALADSGRVELITEAQVVDIAGEEQLDAVVIEQDRQGRHVRPTDHFIPLFGLSPKLGPLAGWGLNIDKNAIEVNTLDYSTNIPGVYAVGDINTYPGKLKLILCGFHEGTLMVQSAFRHIYPERRLNLKYTTVNGVQGF